MDAAPKISVLLPCYRQERFVREAIESVLMQDFPDWEMVASDDASPDGTAAILEHYAGRDARIRFSRQEKNLGMVENWNWCLQQARGTAIKLMGADDRLETPDCLTRQWQSLQPPGVALAACGRHLMDADSRVVKTLQSLPTGVYPTEKIIPQLLLHQDNLVGEPVCCLFRKSRAERGFNPAYRQNADVEMWLYLLETGPLAYEQEPLAGFRTHAGQQSQAHWEKDLGFEHKRLLLETARVSRIPPETKLKVLFRSEEWLAKNPAHPGVAGIRALAAELRSSFSPMEIGLERIRHRAGKTLVRWGRSIQKRLPFSQDRCRARIYARQAAKQ